jgi:hypothetical protein
LGRAAFVDGLLSFDGPFPDLSIADFIHLNDANTAAIMYYFQGHQTGEFNGVSSSSAAVQVLNGELMEFDQDVLLNKLISINELNILQLQITANEMVSQFKNVTLLDNQQPPKAFRDSIKNITAKFNQNFNLKNNKANLAFVTDDVKIFTNQGLQTGKDAFLALFTTYEMSHPDLIAHDEYLLGDGHFTAVEFIWQGEFVGPFTLTDGTLIKPTNKSYRTRPMRWFKFNDE